MEECARRSIELLKRNLTPAGILAASPGPVAEAKSYTRIFGRDAAICALGMAGCGDSALERGAVAGLDSLAAQQAPNGQIPKFVDETGEEADFWYLGCIDATLWWLLAVHHVRANAREPGIAKRWLPEVDRALGWLQAQEHQRFYLLQQNEASDWADVMPRSGFVLYSNALWYCVKQRYALSHVEQTRHHFNHLFHPFSGDLPEYRRARLLQHYARRTSRNRDVYLSFVNFAVSGDEGDVFGNLLAILLGLGGDATAQRIIRVLQRRAVGRLGARVVLDPMRPGDKLWRAYMERHQQNLASQYHNGGVWPFVDSFRVMALMAMGKAEPAQAALENLAWANSLDDWRFTEWFHGETHAPLGMAGQSWNAATFLMARRMVEEGIRTL